MARTGPLGEPHFTSQQVAAVASGTGITAYCTIVLDATLSYRATARPGLLVCTSTRPPY